MWSRTMRRTDAAPARNSVDEKATRSGARRSRQRKARRRDASPSNDESSRLDAVAMPMQAKLMDDLRADLPAPVGLDLDPDDVSHRYRR